MRNLVCMYLKKKNFSEQGSVFDAGLALSQDFLLIVTKKIMPFLLFENIFAKKLGFNENPGK